MLLRNQGVMSVVSPIFGISAEDRALESIKKADLGDRFITMPNGLETHLYNDFEDDGLEISGGEARKIAIAGALL